MTIDQCCKGQQAIADRIFMDFKYTEAGSDEQLRSLEILHALISRWATVIINDECVHNEEFTLQGVAQANLC